MEGELKVRHMRYQIAQYEFLIRSVPKTTRFPSKRSFRPNYLILSRPVILEPRRCRAEGDKAFIPQGNKNSTPGHTTTEAPKTCHVYLNLGAFRAHSKRAFTSSKSKTI